MIHLEKTASREWDSENDRSKHPLVNDGEESFRRILVFFSRL